MSFPDGQVDLWVSGESGSTDPKRFRKVPMVFHLALGRPGHFGWCPNFCDFYFSPLACPCNMYCICANAGILTQ